MCGVRRVMELACGVALALVLVLVIGSSAGTAAEGPLMGPRPVYATTALVTDGNANCVIIFADGEGYEALAQKIAAKIQAKTGMRGDVPVLSSKEVTDRPYHLDDAYRQKHLIVLGNSVNNVAHLAMYANLRAMADAEWPGTGNYELRTACDPFWTGHNGIVLGSTDLAGVVAATDELLARLDTLTDGPTLPLPRWCTVVIDGKDQVDVEVELGTYKAPAASRPAQLSFLWATVAYQRTGNAKLLAHLQDWMEWLSENSCGTDHYYRVAWIDPLEICSNFELVDAAALAKMDTWLYDSLIEGRDYSHVLGARSGNYGNRHQTYGTYGFFRAYRYLLRGAPNEAACQVLEPLAKGTHEYLDSLLAGYREDAEEGESFDTEGIQVRFASGEGRFDWWTSGQGRLAALRALFCRDNLGFFCGSGGGWWSAADLRRPIAHENVVAASAFFDRDPELASFGYRCSYIWTVQMPNWPPPADLKPTPPVSLLGAQVLPVSPPHWDRPHKHPSIADVSYDRCFEKLVFREGFEGDDQYMILQGLDTGSDVNAIIRYTDRGHIFFMQSQKAQNYFYRNGVYVSHGLDEKAPPPMAELRVQTNDGDVSMTATVLRDYHGVDWQRNIIYRRGTYFVVIDTCRAQKAGQYGLTCVWRSPTGGRLDGNTWTNRQGRDILVLRSAAGSHMRLERIKDRPAGDWDEAPGFTVLQDRSGQKSGGEVTTFRNLFYTTGPGDAQDFQLRPVGDSAVVVKGRRQVGDQPIEEHLALIGVGSLSKGDLRIDAEVFYLSGAKVSLADEGTATLVGQPVEGGAVLERALQELWAGAAVPSSVVAVAGGPTLADVDPLWRNEVTFIRPEPITSVSVTGDKPFVAGTPDDLIDGHHPMYFNLTTKWKAGTVLTFDLGAPTELAEIDLRFDLRVADEKLSEPNVTVEVSHDDFANDRRQISFTAEDKDQYEVPWNAYDYLALAGTTIPVNRSARQVNLTLEKAGYGAEVIFRRSGTRRARPRWLHVADLDGNGASEIIVATDLEEVCVFSADGRRLWSAIVDGWISALLCADLEDDGRKEVIVSTFDSSMYAFDAAGKQRWHWNRKISLSEFGGMGLWQRDDDGRTQVLGTGYIGFVSVDADGQEVAAPEVGGVRMDAALPVGVDMTGDGVDDQLAHGYFTDNVFLLDGKSLLQAKSVGVPTGPALGLCLIDQQNGVTRALSVTTGGITMMRITEHRIKAGGRVVDTSGGESETRVSTASPAVETPWSYAIGPINAFALIEQAGGTAPLIAVGKRDGRLILLDAEGRLVRDTVMGGAIRGLAATGAGERVLLAVATAKGVHVLDDQLKPRADVHMPNCGAVAWLADDQRLAVVGMTDHGDVAAYPVR